MPAAKHLRFDVHAVEALAGGKTFARGEAYFRDGLVTILGMEPGRLVARIMGTKDYRTVLIGQGTRIGGECSCPAFERDGFCKHMVAAALAGNAAAASGETGGGVLARIRDHLATRDTAYLAGIIMEIAERDSALLRKLEIAAAAAGADDGALEAQLRAAILDATHTYDFVDYEEAPGWAAGVQGVLELLGEIATGPRAALAVALAEEAIDRIEQALEHIDDSDGHCWVLLERAQEIHLDACRAARPDPVTLACALFQRETESGYDVFTGAAASYEDILGEDGLAEYRRLAQDAWDRLPVQVGPQRNTAAYRLGERTLASILDFFAERDGDVDTRIALRSKDLSSPARYLELAKFCQEQGRRADALRHAEDGLWLFEDRPTDEPLLLFTAGLLKDAGRAADAEAHLWRAFGKTPSLNLCEHLRTLGGEQAIHRIIALLRDRLARKAASHWHFPADLLVRILIKETMFDTAWSVVSEHGASEDVKQALASGTEKTHPRQALAVYEERVEELARRGGDTNYAEAATLIARMGGLRGAAEQTAYVADLKERHGRKRNFMKLLG